VHLSELDDDGGGNSDGVRHGGSDQEAESGTAASGLEAGSVGHDRGWRPSAVEQAVSGATGKKSQGRRSGDGAVE
jgi:hypothetical protein